jgi:hypothetical protein
MVELEDQLVLADSFIVRTHLGARGAVHIPVHGSAYAGAAHANPRTGLHGGAGVAGTVYAVLCRLTSGLKPANERLAGALRTLPVWRSAGS